ncbi:hypothetical protein Tco_0243149, partial [Tanacetum coccineum]
SPPVRRALSSRLKLRHLRKVRVQRKDADTSFEIGPHTPWYTQLLAKSSNDLTNGILLRFSFFTSRSTISIGSSTNYRFSSISISSKGT